MKLFSIIFLVFLLFACKKTPLNEVSDSFIGIWKHYLSKSDAHTIVVLADGTGYMTSTYEGKESKPTKTREWFLEDNELFFGKVTFNGESYEVDKYPTFAWNQIINLNDTVPAGKKYVILNGNYYTEQ